MILVDSSVWISAWKGVDASLTSKLSELIELEEVGINPLIRMELLQGASDTKHQNQIRVLLDPVPIQEISSEIWYGTPVFSLQQRQKGVTLTTVDCLIAYQAKILNASLWSLDRVFEKISGVRMYRLTPPPTNSKIH